MVDIVWYETLAAINIRYILLFVSLYTQSLEASKQQQLKIITIRVPYIYKRIFMSCSHRSHLHSHRLHLHLHGFGWLVFSLSQSHFLQHRHVFFVKKGNKNKLNSKFNELQNMTTLRFMTIAIALAMQEQNETHIVLYTAIR